MAIFNPNLSKKSPTFIIPIIAGGILLVIIGAIVVLSLQGQIAPQNQSGQTPTQDVLQPNVVVEEITPKESTILSLDTKPTFLVTFNQPVSYSLVVVEFAPVEQDVNTPVFTTNLSQVDAKTIMVEVQEALTLDTQYALSISKHDQTRIASFTFTSAHAPLPRIETNNTTLSQYLPYETDSYKIEYVGSQNLYLFHFKYNPDSPLTITDQFNAAKAAATAFITSKGIDLSTIVIEWRSS